MRTSGFYCLTIVLSMLMVSCGNSRRLTTARATEPSLVMEHELLSRESETTAQDEEDHKENAQTNLYAYLEEWKGTPHRMGGNSRKGVDCSGLVCRVYEDVYSIDLKSRRAADIFKELDRIDRKDLREGDLVFFKIRRSGIDHVGIYLSDDNFVHTSSTRGVMISSLNEPYFRERFFAGGRRPE